MIKPKTRIAMKEAFDGLRTEIAKLREEKPSERGGTDVYVVSLAAIDTKEQRNLNVELGLDTQEGISKWYKKS